MAKYQSPCAPNSSIASTSDATTQLLAPQNTPANPRAAPKPAGMPSSGVATQPKVAPTKKLGTTSPPLKPELRVRAVSRILTIQSHGRAWPCSTAAAMMFTPAPL